MQLSEAKKIIQKSVIKTKIGLVITALVSIAPGGFMVSNAFMQWDPMTMALRVLSVLFGALFIAVGALCLLAAIRPSPLSTLIFSEPEKIVWVYTQGVQMYGRQTNNVNLYICTRDKKHFLLTTKKNVDTLVEVLRAHAKNAHFGYDAEFEKKYHA